MSLPVYVLFLLLGAVELRGAIQSQADSVSGVGIVSVADSGFVNRPMDVFVTDYGIGPYEQQIGSNLHHLFVSRPDPSGSPSVILQRVPERRGNWSAGDHQFSSRAKGSETDILEEKPRTLSVFSRSVLPVDRKESETRDEGVSEGDADTKPLRVCPPLIGLVMTGVGLFLFLLVLCSDIGSQGRWWRYACVFPFSLLRVWGSPF
jgi:hypothetical protein